MSVLQGGENVVFLAARSGLCNVMKYLIKLGVPVNTMNKLGVSPVHAAILNQHTGNFC